jgi:hypothetical protein
MTSWPEEPPTGQPQAQTRRQAREFERSRRAGTAEPTPAGQIPEMSTSGPSRERSDASQDSAAPQAPDGGRGPEQPTIPASAFAEPGVSSPSRESFDLFRQGPDTSRPEPVTQPMTVLQPPVAAPQQPPAPAAASAAPSSAPERTLTRRELRAMMQAQQANAQANHTTPAGEQVFPVSFTPEPEAEATRATTDAAPAAPETPTGEKSAWPFAPLTPSSAPAAPAAPRTAQPETTVTQTSASPFAAFGAPTTGRTATSESAANASAGPAAAPAPEDTSAQERRPFTPPTGHWSTAAELEDQNQPITSRNVAQSTAATTTNALILPAIPQPDATAPLTSTGEILVTGSIDLPRSVGSTGAHPDRIDSSDIDRLLDGDENEFNTSEVQPVRASRAISTHTSTRGVIAPPKKRGNTLPIVLMITAGVLAVGVIGLLVAAYVLKVF